MLRRYRDYSDEALAHAATVSVGAVREFLRSAGAQRTAGEDKRAARTNVGDAPAMWTPRRARHAITGIRTRPLDRRDRWLVLAMFLGSLLLYGLTAARTVTGEDAGELLAAAHGFGVPHPPGYPLWMMLSYTSDHALGWLLPATTVAWRISLVSVVFSAAANALLLALALKTIHHRLAAVTGVVLFGVSLTHWSQAVIPEVYGLNTFFVLACGWLLLRYRQRPSPGRLVLLAAVMGLSLTNHPTALPVAALVAGGALLIAPAVLRRPVVLAGATLAGLAPLLLYLVLPLASASDPYVDWGDPETKGALIDHVMRSQYAATEAEREETAADYGSYLSRLSLLAGHMGRQFASPWLLILPATGFFTLLILQPGLWIYLVGVGWTCSVLFTRWSNYSFDREHTYANSIFFIPAWLALSWLAAGGLDTILGTLSGRAARVRRIAAPALAVLLVGAVAQAAVAHYPRADRSRTTAIADYGKAILDTMGEGALYFPSSDHSTFAVMYWQGVEGHRLDVVVADKTGIVEPHLVRDYLTPQDGAVYERLVGPPRRAFLEARLIERWPGPVYFANQRDMSDLPDRRLEPVGPIFQVLPEEVAERLWTRGEDGVAGLAPWRDLDSLLVSIDERQRLDFTVQMIEGDLRYLKGYALLRAGDLAVAIETWGGIAADLAPVKQVFNNIGSALAEAGRPHEALRFYGRALDEDEGYVVAWRNKATVHQTLGQASQAAMCLERAVEGRPRDRGLRLALARLLAQDDSRAVQALAQYEQLAVQDRRDPLPWREAGRLLERLGDVAKAQAAYTSSLERDPDQRDVAAALDRMRQGGSLLAEGVEAEAARSALLVARPVRPPSPELGEGLPVPVLPDPTPLLPRPEGLVPPPPAPPSAGWGVMDDRQPVAEPATIPVRGGSR